MNLDSALRSIGAFLSLDPDELIAYAQEDSTLGGYHHDPQQATFPIGSLWGVEGQVLYALVRALKPLDLVELGTYHGASTTHLATALHENGRGGLISVDIWEGAGSLVPKALDKWWSIVYEEAVYHIEKHRFGSSLAFVFEDCIHSESEVFAIVTALKPKLAPGAVVVHHDSEHGDDGVQVKRALTRAGVNWRSWLIDPADCGLAIWRNE